MLIKQNSRGEKWVDYLPVWSGAKRYGAFGGAFVFNEADISNEWKQKQSSRKIETLHNYDVIARRLKDLKTATMKISVNCFAYTTVGILFIEAARWEHCLKFGILWPENGKRGACRRRDIWDAMRFLEIV